MQDASLNTLLAIPWAKALIEDPKWTCAVTPSRVPKSSGEDELYAVTLATDRTFRAYQTLRPTKELGGKLVYHEIKGIVTLGDGLAGFAGVCHGGIAATLLDETCGILVGSSQERHLERWKQSGASDQPPKLNFMTVCKSMRGPQHLYQTDTRRSQHDLQATDTRA